MSSCGVTEEIADERDIRNREPESQQRDDAENRSKATPLGAVVVNARASARGKGVRLHDEDGFPPASRTPA